MGATVTLDDRVQALASPVHGVRVWALRLEARSRDAEVACPEAEDLERLAGMREPDAGRLLARRALLRLVVAEVSGCAPDQVQVLTGPGPRTVTVPGLPPWYVSMSSSGACAVLALADVPVGADLEQLPGPPDALQVSAHLLPAAEHAWISAGGADAPGRFLATWVRKEAVVKLTGEGLSRDLRSFVVDAGAASAPVRTTDGATVGIRTSSLAFPGHTASVAVTEGWAPGRPLGAALATRR
jgi:4'-phosphopantetheinyl transferase